MFSGKLLQDPVVNGDGKDTVVQFKILNKDNSKNRITGDNNMMIFYCEAEKYLNEQIIEELKKGMEVSITSKACQKTINGKSGEPKTFSYYLVQEIDIYHPQTKLGVPSESQKKEESFQKQLEAMGFKNDPWEQTHE